MSRWIGPQICLSLRAATKKAFHSLWFHVTQSLLKKCDMQQNSMPSADKLGRLIWGCRCDAGCILGRIVDQRIQVTIFTLPHYLLILSDWVPEDRIWAGRLPLVQTAGLVAVLPFCWAGELARVALWERARLSPGYVLRSPIASYFPLYWKCADSFRTGCTTLHCRLWQPCSSHQRRISAPWVVMRQPNEAKTASLYNDRFTPVLDHITIDL
jgi:hypothetical protein